MKQPYEKGEQPMKRIAVLLIIAIVIGVIPATDASQAITKPYDFPIRPGTDAWRAFTTHVEMVEACQIPEDVLVRMTTEALVKTVSTYPLAIDIMAFDTNDVGVRQVIENFNGLQELLVRADVGERILDHYVTMGPHSRNASRVYMLFFETLLVQEPVVTSFTPAGLDRMLRVAHEKYEIKRKDPSYGVTMLEPTGRVMYEYLEVSGALPSSLGGLRESTRVDVADLDRIAGAVKTYLDTRPGSEVDR